jgi:hypothetical protein
MLFPEPGTTLAATIVAEDEESIALRNIARPCASSTIYEFSITYTQAP